MNFDDFGPGDLLTAIMAGAALLTSIFRGGKSAGDADGRIKAMEDRVPHLASKSSVDNLTERVGRIQERVDDVEHVANTAEKDVATINMRITGLDRLMRHGFNNTQASMQTLATFMGKTLPRVPELPAPPPE